MLWKPWKTQRFFTVNNSFASLNSISPGYDLELAAQNPVLLASKINLWNWIENCFIISINSTDI